MQKNKKMGQNVAWSGLPDLLSRL